KYCCHTRFLTRNRGVTGCLAMTIMAFPSLSKAIGTHFRDLLSALSWNYQLFLFFKPLICADVLIFLRHFHFCLTDYNGAILWIPHDFLLYEPVGISDKLKLRQVHLLHKYVLCALQHLFLTFEINLPFAVVITILFHL